MIRICTYAVARLRDGAYRLDRAAQPTSGPVATILAVTDRTGQVVGWRLQPHLVIQGSRSKLWPTPAEALSSIKLMTAGQARTAITLADASAGKGTP